MLSDAFGSVLGKLYEPAAEPHDWPSVLTLVSRLFGNAGVGPDPPGSTVAAGDRYIVGRCHRRSHNATPSASSGQPDSI